MSYFSLSEFRCPCGRPDCTAPRPDPRLLEVLEALRADFGGPIRITSGSRCPWQNARVGGRPDSAHLTGEAADLACPDSRTRWGLLQGAMKLVTRLGVGATFLHVDVSTRHAPNVVWHYYPTAPPVK